MKARIYPVFNKKRSLDLNGEGLIHILIYFSRSERKFISTGLHVEPKYWDDKRNEVSPRHPKSVEYNTIIKKFITNIENFQLKLISQDIKFTPYRLDIFLKSGSDKSFTEFCDFELINASNLSKDTKRVQKSSLNKLKNFNDNIYFSDISYNLIEEFDKFMHDKGLKLNTIAKVHTHIKKFINLAIKKDLLKFDDNPYKKFKIRHERTVRPWLSKSEIEKIEAINYDNNLALDRLKDMFLFACYTGLRFGDLINLSKEIIQNNENGEMFIELHRMRKSDKKVYLPVSKLFNGKPAQIIEKYFKRFPDHELLFGDPLTNQYMNRELKYIAKHAGLKKELTSHVARHTFGSILASVKPDPYLIMELMGHSKLATSMVYIHDSRERIDNQLDDIEW